MGKAPTRLNGPTQVRKLEVGVGVDHVGNQNPIIELDPALAVDIIAADDIFDNAAAIEADYRLRL